ncbi:MAG TPA: CobW family GTP-binding protein [Burkholderiales bacterium]|nr:CobW family GTP-binding protein [Burkholderiales bacterium]
MSGAPIPVTVIGGYLGAGKTTLVNHLLRHAGRLRIAVLVNDFGELPIDADLIESREGDTLAIAGGCVCCSFGSDLIAALRLLAAREPQPAYLLVEASGVALPRAVAASISLLPDYANDGIVVLADAETVRERAADTYLGDTIERQLAEAGLILLTKPELAEPDERQRTRVWLERYAPVLDCEHGRVPLELLLGAQPATYARLPASGGLHPAYDSVAFDGLGPLDVARLAEALTESSLGVLRAKGVLRDTTGGTLSLQVVGRRAETARVNVAEAGRLVCIGLEGRLDRGGIEARLSGALHAA